MSTVWVESTSPLPEPARAAHDAELLAAGLDLSVPRLQEAYAKGLFPWYETGQPVLWWSPNPRMVLRCRDFHASGSLAKRIRQFDRDTEPGLRVQLNTAFGATMRHCAARGAARISLGRARRGQSPQPPAAPAAPTWINPDMLQVYSWAHQAGLAHSVETWVGEQLLGGLYGVSIGGAFFGESMFSLAPDTSKIALAYLLAYLSANGVEWLDCQQYSAHLASLGARLLPRAQFLEMLASARVRAAPAWGRGRLRAHGALEPMA